MLRKIILISAQIKAAIALATGGLRGELATKTCLFCFFLVTQIAFYSVLFASPFHYLFNQVCRICVTCLIISLTYFTHTPQLPPSVTKLLWRLNCPHVAGTICPAPMFGD